MITACPLARSLTWASRIRSIIANLWTSFFPLEFVFWRSLYWTEECVMSRPHVQRFLKSGRMCLTWQSLVRDWLIRLGWANVLQNFVTTFLWLKCVVLNTCCFKNVHTFSSFLRKIIIYFCWIRHETLWAFLGVVLMGSGYEALWNRNRNIREFATPSCISVTFPRTLLQNKHISCTFHSHATNLISGNISWILDRRVVILCSVAQPVYRNNLSWNVFLHQNLLSSHHTISVSSHEVTEVYSLVRCDALLPCC
jgi:hypothetical protein